MEEQNIENLIQKHQYVLDLFNDLDKQHINNLAVIIEIGTNHLNTNHKELNSQTKTSAMYVVKEQYFKNLIRSDNDIVTNIDQFLNTYQLEFEGFKHTHLNDFSNINLSYLKEYLNR